MASDPRATGRPDGSSGPETPTRRQAVIRLLGAISGLIGAVLGVPLALFVFGPTVRGKSRWLASVMPPDAPLGGGGAPDGVQWLGRATPPTLRARDPWVPVGEVKALPAGVPTLVTVRMPVEDGWVRDVEPVAVYARRDGADQAAVLDIHCTHLGCPVSWNRAAGRFFCPCHGGVYDSAGRVVAGPPPRRLDRYAVKVENGTLYMGALLPPDS